MIAWLLARRELLRRPGRAALTTLGIAIGVAAMIAVGVTVETTRVAYDDLFATMGGRASLEITTSGLGGFAPGEAGAVSEVDGIRAAVPVVQTTAAIRAGRLSWTVNVLGIDPARDPAVRRFVLREGRGLDVADGLLLEAEFAKRMGLALGDHPRLIGPAGSREIELIGLLEPTGAADVVGGALALLRLETAQRTFHFGDRVTALQLVLDDDVRRDGVRDALRRRLPPELTVEIPAARGALAQDGLQAARLGLESLSSVSLIAGAFVILNAFLMSLGERRRQIAVLRALGTTRRQVLQLYLGQAVLLGIVGTVLGIGLGLVAAWGFTRGMEKLLITTLPALRLSVEPFVLAGLLGPGIAIAATWIPARRAAWVEPLEGIADHRARESERTPRLPVICGLTLVGLAAATVPLFVYAPWFPPGVAAPAVSAFVVGCVLALPALFRPLIALAMPLLAGPFGIEGRLALRRLDRNRARTGVTVGVLFIAIVMSVGIGNLLLNQVRDLDDWYERAIRGDFFVRASFPDVGLMTAASIPAEIAAEIGALDGVVHASRVSFVPTRVRAKTTLVIAIDLTADGRLPLDLEVGDPADVRRRLLTGEVVLGTTLALELRAAPGETIELGTPHGPRSVRIAGTTTEYTAGGRVVYMEWSHASALLASHAIHVVAIAARPDAGPQLEIALEDLCREHDLILQSRAELRRAIDEMTDGIFGFIWVLMALIFVVASLGIVNTLTMNVLEQTRELGVLRAIAMTRHQVKKLVMAQAAAMLVVSLVPGLPLGILVSWLMGLTVYPLTGQPLPFRLEPGILLMTAVVAALLTFAAAWLPARRAGRLAIIHALHYE